MWFHFPALIARSDAIDTPPPAPDRGLLSSCGFVFGVMLVCVWSGVWWCGDGGGGGGEDV